MIKCPDYKKLNKEEKDKIKIARKIISKIYAKFDYKSKNNIHLYWYPPRLFQLVSDKNIAGSCLSTGIEIYLNSFNDVVEIEELKTLLFQILEHELTHEKLGHYEDCGKTKEEMEIEVENHLGKKLWS